MAGPSMQPLFDYAGSLKRMGGDEELFGEMVGLLETDAPLWLDRIREGLAAGDAKLVHRSAHTLKGIVANFGALPAMSAAAHVEKVALDDPGLELARSALPALEAAILELQAALAAYRRP
jgi:two-component system sensor histidine kinase/response regulator